MAIIIQKKKIIEKLFIAALIVYPIFHFCVFWIYINFDTIVTSFQKFNYYTGELDFCGFENYERIFKKMILGEDEGLRRAFFNSFQAIGINLIILPIAVFSAYAFYKRMPGTAFYSVMFYIPQLISIVVLTMVFRYMFDADFGYIALLAKKITGQEIDFLSQSSDHLWSIIWLYCIWSGLGSNVIMMRGAMLKIPKEVTESAVMDGCGFFRELWSIALPLSMSTISIYILMTSMAAASFTMPPMLIAKGSGVNGKFLTVGWFIFSTTANGGSISSSINATTTGILFTILTLPLIIVTKWFTKKITPEI